MFAGTVFPAVSRRTICRSIAAVFRRIGFASIFNYMKTVCAGSDMASTVGTGHSFCICWFRVVAVLAARAAMRCIRGGIHAGIDAKSFGNLAYRTANTTAASQSFIAFDTTISAAILGVLLTGGLCNVISLNTL